MIGGPGPVAVPELAPVDEGRPQRIRVDERGTDLEAARAVLAAAYAGVEWQADLGDNDFSFHYAAAGEPVGDELDEEVLGGHQLPPRREGRVGQVVAAAGHGRAQLGGGAEQDDQVAVAERAGELLGQEPEIEHRVPPLSGQVGRRDQATQRRPA